MFQKKLRVALHEVGAYVIAVLFVFVACAPTATPTSDPSVQLATAVAIVRTATAQAASVVTPTVVVTSTSTREPTATATQIPTSTPTSTPTLLPAPALIKILSLVGFRTIGSQFTRIEFSPDGKTITSEWSMGSPFGIILWDVSTGQSPHKFSSQRGFGGAAYSPDGKVYAVGTRGMVTVKDVATEQTIREFGSQSVVPGVISLFRADQITFSPDGKMLATGSGTIVMLWDYPTAQRLRSIDQKLGTIDVLVFSLDGKTLASGNVNWGTLTTTDAKYEVKAWDVNTGQLLLTVSEPKEQIRGIAFSPDGRILATGHPDKTVKFWDLSRGQLLRTLPESPSAIYGIAFSRDGKLLATSSCKSVDANKVCNTSQIRLWEVTSGQSLLTFDEQDSWVWCLAFSPDGKILASGGDAGVKLWNLLLK